MVREKLKDWFKQQSDEERCVVIKDYALRLNSQHKKMIKTMGKEFDDNGLTSGTRRSGRSVSIMIRSQNAREDYNDTLETLKYMIGVQ